MTRRPRPVARGRVALLAPGGAFLPSGLDSAPVRLEAWRPSGHPRPGNVHVVGAQFDTVYAEGGSLLRPDRDASGTRGGGSQALALQPAQGGFVEAAFGEAGRYPLVTRAMADAEHGAHGVVVVR
ncbi:hypothetical protein [Propionicimonas sp. T2.31MG-18]|uniref:hypothetical protein n=1 Tax=Propionicimonas sp. T2.31MG-18 TaxID=3157620 RepID=UPI00367105D2